MNNKEDKSKQIDTLLRHICDLSMMWRGQPENRQAIETEYHDTYKKLRALGWDQEIDRPCNLPRENMPKEYIDTHPYIESTLPWPDSWRGSNEIKEIEQRRRQKKSIVQRLKEWLK